MEYYFVLIVAILTTGFTFVIILFMLRDYLPKWFVCDVMGWHELYETTFNFNRDLKSIMCSRCEYKKLEKRR